jgi:hypothetical protein
MLTFMASGKDLPHPEEETEKARKQALRAEAGDEPPEDTEAGKAPKVQVTVSDSEGKVIRQFKSPVVQGINRLNWDLGSNGARPMPGPKPVEPDADLPAGAEVPPGTYQITLALGEGAEKTETSSQVKVLADPRPGISQANRESNYQSLKALQALEETAVSAVERIVSVRKDLDTLVGLIDKQTIADDGAKTLKDQAKSLQKQLNELELRFRVLPETRGYVYEDDKVASRIGAAQFYIGSSLDAATPASAAYVQLAEDATDSAIADLNAFLNGPLQQFRYVVKEAGVGLLSDSAAISRSP